MLKMKRPVSVAIVVEDLKNDVELDRILVSFAGGGYEEPV